MDSTEVSIFQEIEVTFSSLLEGENSGALESDVLLELRTDLADESLEGELSDEEVVALLETSNLTESNSARSKSAGLIDSTRSNEPSIFRQLLSDVLSGSHPTVNTFSGLLVTSHFVFNI
jgi:hypothetical protein